jgi:hypothetical protein
VGHTLYIDFETYYDSEVSLERMTLRTYFETLRQMADRGVLGCGYAIDDMPEEFFHGMPPAEFIEFLRYVCESDEWTVVAHNAAFDVRVMRFLLDLPQPQHVHCTLELAYAAFPNQPGGYALKELSTYLGLGEKIAIDLKPGEHTPEALETYCKRDVELCRKLHPIELSRLEFTAAFKQHAQAWATFAEDPFAEVIIQEMAQKVRELCLHIDSEAVRKAVEAFNNVSNEEAAAAAAALGIPLAYNVHNKKEAKAAAFGLTEDLQLKSVKPKQLKEALLDICAFDTQSISVKKINPARLQANERAAKVVHAAARANKALSHRRKMAVFSGVPVVDVELSYHAAHTGRYSSKMAAGTSGHAPKGVNLHNLPKRNKKVAEPIRKVFRTDAEHCWVSGDLANAEYRMEGWLTGCRYVEELYSRNLLIDPYSEFGQTATGTHVDKSMPVRQVWKNSVLGLGFDMGIQRWINELLLMLADYEVNKVTLQDLRDLCHKNGWTPTTDGRARAAQVKLGAPWEVATVAFHSRRLFHEIHPEFHRTAAWVMDALKAVASALDPAGAIEQAYLLPSAPDRSRINLVYDPTLGPGRTVRVCCGGWTPTVTWRDIGVHDTKFGPCFSCLASGDKGYRALSPSVVIENITQSAARNALVKGKLRLRSMGYDYIMSVHDEAKIWTPRNCSAVLDAADAMMKVYGPGNDLGWGWAVCMNPKEITVTESLWEKELGDDFWTALCNGDDSVLANLV